MPFYMIQVKYSILNIVCKVHVLSSTCLVVESRCGKAVTKVLISGKISQMGCKWGANGVQMGCKWSTEGVQRVSVPGTIIATDILPYGNCFY